MSKNKKRTPEQFAAAKKFATEVTGYGPQSPIWGKRLPDVLSSIEADIRIAIDDIDNGGADIARKSLSETTLVTIEELKKRLAKGAIISSQLK